MNNSRSLLVMPLLSAALGLTEGCGPDEPNQLDKLGTVSMTIKDQRFELWIADDDKERERGLMFVTHEQMAPRADGAERGMIFVFDHDERSSFWMRNTIIPLDIAYLGADGTVITTYTMAALDDRYNQYPPLRAYRYAVEVRADRWKSLSLNVGDRVEIPASLKPVPK